MSAAPAWIDTHCHLAAAEFDPDRAAVIAAAGAAGVSRIVVPAVCAAEFARVRACCIAANAAPAAPRCFAAYGIHPLYAAQAGAADLTLLRRFLLDDDCVALGEVGLDFFLPGFDAARQLEVLRAQLRLARDLDLPVLLHLRRAIDPLLGELRRHGVRAGIAHAFNGSAQQAAAFIDLGFKLGFGGAMCSPRARRLRALAASLPLDALVLETDAPDMAPFFLPPRADGSRRNEPALLPRIAATLAELRQISLAEIAVATTDNALSICKKITQ